VLWLGPPTALWHITNISLAGLTNQFCGRDAGLKSRTPVIRVKVSPDLVRANTLSLTSLDWKNNRLSLSIHNGLADLHSVPTKAGTVVTRSSLHPVLFQIEYLGARVE
jgi:hypothetical protein